MDTTGEEVRLAGGGGNGYADIDLDIPIDPVNDLVYRVIESYQSSAKSLWQCAEYTWSLFNGYGLYERYFTDTLSQTLAVQKDTLYHWRKAWDLRLKILEALPDFNFSGLSITHFYHSADYVDRMGVEWVAEWLQEAREESWSSRKLSAELDIATNESGTAPWIYGKISKVATRLERLFEESEYSGLPEHKREKLHKVIQMLKEITE